MLIRQRIWEIDFLRGIAICMMVLFHLVVDLADFYEFPFNYMNGFWYYEGKLAAILFVSLAGVSTRFSSNNFKRGLVILGWGLILTVLTYVYNPNTYIRFGILHLLGSSLILFHYFKSTGAAWLGVIALMLFGIAYTTAGKVVQSPIFIPVGLPPADFVSLDYYPLLPWLSVFLLGVLGGRYLYKQPKSLFSEFPHQSMLTILGRHSLTVYLIHQPLLLAALYMFHLIGII